MSACGNDGSNAVPVRALASQGTAAASLGADARSHFIAVEGIREVGGAGGGDEHGGPHGDHGVRGGAHYASPMTTPTPGELTTHMNGLFPARAAAAAEVSGPPPPPPVAAYLGGPGAVECAVTLDEDG